MSEKGETFWEAMERGAARARGWPDWMKGGINLNEKNFISFRAGELKLSEGPSMRVDMNTDWTEDDEMTRTVTLPFAQEQGPARYAAWVRYAVAVMLRRKRG